MSRSPLNVVYLTPGAGGMYCGSCMNDNMLAATMMQLGHTVTLVPIYTPTMTDEPNVSIDKLFFGGVNVYLQEKFPPFRFVPRFMDRVLDRPWLVQKLAGSTVGLEAKQLGAMTLSMVRGEHGHQRKEVRRLVDWLRTQPAPHIVNLSNLLIAGCLPALRRQLDAAIIVTLQGDDLFLDDLPQPYRGQVMTELRKLARNVDRFIAHSQFYANLMAEFFDVPIERFDIVPLGISLDGFPAAATAATNNRPATVGYLARICPAKGFHVLVDAFLQIKGRPGFDATRLAVAGWLGEGDRPFFDEQMRRIRAAGHADDVHHAGALNRAEKIAFLEALDVFAVPTTYREPKGRFVLEALASGVPVVVPDHGAFPEILDRTGGGRLVRPNDAAHLTEVLSELLADSNVRHELGQAGRKSVHRDATALRAAEETVDAYRKCLAAQS
ncbi:MAG: glycosyltransferase family 4 protein [Pirellulales bacterium]